jgi:two-component system sensor histidine kinase PilS (NtrC family)
MATAEHSLSTPLRLPADDTVRLGQDDVPRRLARILALFRVAVTTAMLLVALAGADTPLLGTRNPALFVATGACYLAMGLGLLAWLWPRPATPPGIALAILGLDIAAITLLMHAAGGVGSGIGALLVVFVGAGTLVLRGQHAFLVAATAALAVLGEQGLSLALGRASLPAFFPAGVLGGIIFMIASAAAPLSRRLQESEALARQRGIDLANLAQLNDYIIQNLRESIIVVDEADRIRLINQSAAEQLGLRQPRPGQELERHAPKLHRVLTDWRRQGNTLLQPPPFLSGDGSTRISAYLAPLGGQQDGPILMFLEDTSELAEKVQQSKLAALGRLSASIAHEIRNPVGALSHAGQLLEESPALSPGDRRLIDIIRTNSRRVNEIVESVLQLSRRDTTRPALVYLADWARDFAREFTTTMELFEGQVTVLPAAGDVEVRIDPGHLRQVAWNLCENAVKYASEAAGGIQVEIGFGRLPGTRRPYLTIADRGPGIPEELREQVFEPFATGPNGGTGLGLFISRELCECNRAMLAYEPRDGGGSQFRIVFADPARWGT